MIRQSKGVMSSLAFLSCRVMNSCLESLWHFPSSTLQSLAMQNAILIECLQSAIRQHSSCTALGLKRASAWALLADFARLSGAASSSQGACDRQCGGCIHGCQAYAEGLFPQQSIVKLRLAAPDNDDSML